MQSHQEYNIKIQTQISSTCPYQEKIFPLTVSRAEPLLKFVPDPPPFNELQTQSNFMGSHALGFGGIEITETFTATICYPTPEDCETYENELFGQDAHNMAIGDFNNDGYIDVLSNGSILLNNGDFTFTQYDAGVPGPGAIGDANNDGFLDVFNGNNLYQNNDNGNNWLKIITVGTTSNINGIGARIEIASPQIGTQIRDVTSGTGFRYMGSLNTYFGLGEDTNITTLTVYWPSGTVDTLNNVSVNQPLEITEGQTLSTEIYSLDQITVFPNPADNYITIKSDYNLEDAIISLFDLNGRRVLNYKNNSNSNIVDISSLSDGEYVLRVILSEGGIYSTKVLKR